MKSGCRKLRFLNQFATGLNDLLLLVESTQRQRLAV